MVIWNFASRSTSCDNTASDPRSIVQIVGEFHMRGSSLFSYMLVYLVSRDVAAWF